MEKPIPITPVVEVRETFTPSERLRNALVDYLDPALDRRTIESLRATFLFKSWRRRVIERNEYYLHEHDKAGAVHDASLRFAALPRVSIPLTGQVGMVYGENWDRIIVRTQDSPVVTQAYEILNTIPTAEIESGSPDDKNIFYVEIAKKSLARRADIDVATFMLRRNAGEASKPSQFFIKPSTIVVRNSFADIPLSEDAGEIDSNAS